MRIIVRSLAVAAILGAVMCAGCSTMGVKPWERDILARPRNGAGRQPRGRRLR